MMGADMCLGWFAIDEKKNNEKDLKQIKEKLIVAIDKLGLKDYEDIQDSLDNMTVSIEDVEIQEDDLRKAILNKIDKDSKKMAEINKVKIVYKKIVEDVFDGIGNRDVTWINHKGDILFVSGGMSWGDAPTEGYTNFNNLTSLPIKVLKYGGIR